MVERELTQASDAPLAAHLGSPSAGIAEGLADPRSPAPGMRRTGGAAVARAGPPTTTDTGSNRPRLAAVRRRARPSPRCLGTVRAADAALATADTILRRMIRTPCLAISSAGAETRPLTASWPRWTAEEAAEEGGAAGGAFSRVPPPAPGIGRVDAAARPGRSGVRPGLPRGWMSRETRRPARRRGRSRMPKLWAPSAGGLAPRGCRAWVAHSD